MDKSFINHKTKNKMKRKVLLFAMGLMFAQGALMLTAKEANATQAATDGNCFYEETTVCGMNGQNFPDKVFVSGSAEVEVQP